MNLKKLIAACSALALVGTANAQMIHGNTFPFWTVTGDLTVGGNATIAGTTTQTGVQTFTAAPVVSALTASLPVFTTAGKALTSNAMTGTGSVVMSASPTLSGSVLLGAGTVANPSIAFSGDPNTGIFSSAANALGVVTDGAERWTFSASGGFNCTSDGNCTIGNGSADPASVSAKTALIIRTAASPASNAACTTGTLYWDASYLYVCTATGVVKRAALTGGY